MKDKLKILFGFILVYICLFVLVFSILFSTSSIVVQSKGETLENGSLLIMFIISLALSLIFVAVYYYTLVNETKFSKFILNHISSFVLFLFLLTIFTVAISNVHNIDLSLSDKLLSAEWTIFGISAAIFLYRVSNLEKNMGLLKSINPHHLYGYERYDHVKHLENTK